MKSFFIKKIICKILCCKNFKKIDASLLPNTHKFRPSTVIYNICERHNTIKSIAVNNPGNS